MGIGKYNSISNQRRSFMMNFKKYILVLALLCTFGQSAVFANDTCATEETQDHAVESVVEEKPATTEEATSGTSVVE